MKKLIPHIYMSKDDFPPGLSPHAVLDYMFLFMEEWKYKLYQLISYNSFTSAPSQQVKAVEQRPSVITVPEQLSQNSVQSYSRSVSPLGGKSRSSSKEKLEKEKLNSKSVERKPVMETRESSDHLTKGGSE